MGTPAKLTHLAIWHDGCLDDQTGIEGEVELRKWHPASGDADFDRQDDKMIVFAGEIHSGVYTNLTKQAFAGIVEYRGPESIPVLNSILRTLASHEIVLNLSSRTAYGLANAERCSEMLSHRVSFPTERQPERLIAIHEAIANAVLHGNLQVDSVPLDEGILGLEKQYDDLEQKLSNPTLGDRRVEISASWSRPELTICITNEGPGYNATKRHHIPSNAPLKDMELIRSLTDHIEIEEKGRQLKLFLRC